ncbi:putative esterase [Rippkaea orientalis PCC 8801]|uniref:Putative esterase n=1 Tax=Rippkaea orientalis (strain PCC 8801 / RF-1) TaxID=41431 RepID=B7K0X2_RIPO1|nr:alpha/beta hydrolase-fold protein [Rippkaea orientalis]ACK65113.1 putative esterase [Rippkaea orientalis PCC 8801]
MAEQFTKGGQEAWYHDRGHWAGYFHTYDRFRGENTEDEPHRLHIFVPRDYEISQEAYPVIYMNDGDTAFFPGGPENKTWNMGKLLTRLYVLNQIHKVILVGICPVNRDYEYTHAPVWGHQWGGLNQYANYVAKSVKGFVDRNYRTLSDPDHSMVLGSSHGGLAAFYTATRHPDQFHLVAALSPSFWVGLDSIDSLIDPSFNQLSLGLFGSLKNTDLLIEGSPALQDPDNKLKIYLDWGLIREGGEHNSFIEARATVRGREMRDLLINEFGYQENKDLFVVEDPIGQHSEESWSGRMESILPLFFGR